MGGTVVGKGCLRLYSEFSTVFATVDEVEISALLNPRE